MELRRPQRGIGVEDEAKTKLIYWRGGDQMAAWPGARVVILTSCCLCGKWIEYNWNRHDGVGWGQGVTRPGVRLCQAQGKVFCLWLGSIKDRIRMCKTNKSKLDVLLPTSHRRIKNHSSIITLHRSQDMPDTFPTLIGTCLLPLLKFMGCW